MNEAQLTLNRKSVRHQHYFDNQIDHFRNIKIQHDTKPFNTPQQDTHRTTPPGNQNKQPDMR